MVHCDTRDRSNNRICYASRVEGARIADGKKQARYATEGGDMSRADRVDGDVRMRSRIAGGIRLGVWRRLEIWVCQGRRFI